MKVCFLVSNLISGGVERTVVYLSKYFANNNIDTTILSLSDEKFYDIDTKVSYISLHIPRGYDNALQKYARIIKRFKGIKENIKKEKYDVVFCMAPEVSRYVLPFYKKGKFKLVSSERNNPLYDNDRDKKIKKELFSMCDGIVFQTERAKQCFPEEIQKRGVVIPNAVGNELAYQIVAPPNKTKRFSAIGRLTKQKDYETMLHAFALFSQKYMDYELDIYGYGEDKEKLVALAKDLNIDKKLNFRGISQDALKEIADSAAFLLSSIYEGIPNVLLEAMAIGMPCVATDCPFGPRELIEDGVNGLLVPVGDADYMARAMIRMVENVDFAVNCGENARNVLKKYRIDEIAARYLDFILTV